MTAAAKLSVSLPAAIHGWAVTYAQEQGVTVSGLIAQLLQERLRQLRQEAALREVLAGVLEEPLSDDELVAADATLAELCAG